jgi:hypothetical protein
VTDNSSHAKAHSLSGKAPLIENSCVSRIRTAQGEVRRCSDRQSIEKNHFIFYPKMVSQLPRKLWDGVNEVDIVGGG